jgi:hypothetical protein
MVSGGKAIKAVASEVAATPITKAVEYFEDHAKTHSPGKPLTLKRYRRALCHFARILGPAVVGILSKIRAGRPELPFFHWGDLDLGGLRILAHLRKNLGEVEPLAMDVAVCDLYLRRSQPLNANEREGLMQLRTVRLLIDCVELIDHLLKTDRKLEQEAIEASSCVKTLQLKQRTTPEIRIND